MTMTSTAAVDRSHNSETATVLELFSSSTSGGANDKTALTETRTYSTNPQQDTTPVWWRTSGVYATSNWTTITFADRQSTTTGNNTANGASSVSSSPMTRFSGSSADVISLTPPPTVAAAATTTAATLVSRETTTRPFEPPFISAGATTTEQLFYTDAGVSASTDRPSEPRTRTDRGFSLPGLCYI